MSSQQLNEKEKTQKGEHGGKKKSGGRNKEDKPASGKIFVGAAARIEPEDHSGVASNKTMTMPEVGDDVGQAFSCFVLTDPPQSSVAQSPTAKPQASSDQSVLQNTPFAGDQSVGGAGLVTLPLPTPRSDVSGPRKRKLVKREDPQEFADITEKTTYQSFVFAIPLQSLNMALAKEKPDYQGRPRKVLNVCFEDSKFNTFLVSLWERKGEEFIKFFQDKSRPLPAVLRVHGLQLRNSGTFKLSRASIKDKYATITQEGGWEYVKSYTRPKKEIDHLPATINEVGLRCMVPGQIYEMNHRSIHLLILSNSCLNSATGMLRCDVSDGKTRCTLAYNHICASGFPDDNINVIVVDFCASWIADVDGGGNTLLITSRRQPEIAAEEVDWPFEDDKECKFIDFDKIRD